ncbi:MAG: hypothetical protein LC730_00135 [Acidobacteria bacterium]|nr:hypothetical protein [Acidobacteriota bacterium]
MKTIFSPFFLFLFASVTLAQQPDAGAAGKDGYAERPLAFNEGELVCEECGQKATHAAL